MSNVLVIGCLHLGHTSIARYRGFETEYEHDEYLISQWNKVVHKKDLVYILGDVTMEKSNDYYQLDRLNGRKVVVLGNHDKWQHVPQLLNYVDGVAGCIDYKGFFLSHAPIHVSEIGQYRGNIHAHIHHENVLADFDVNEMYNDFETPIINTKGKYFNVDAKLMNYQPKTIEQLLTFKQD